MEDENQTRQSWESLHRSGGYSIGQFSVTVQGETLRVYHYRSRKVSFFPMETSSKSIKELCCEYGYELSDLLKYYYPKSIHSLDSYRELVAV